MAPLPRKRSMSDAYDIGNVIDIEKARQAYDSYSDEDSEYDSPSSGHSDGYNSREPMLPRSRTVHTPQKKVPDLRHLSGRRASRSTPAYAYKIPRRITRWLCIILFTSLVVFIFTLWRMSMLSAHALEKAMRERPKPPAPWESFEFLKRYYGGIRTLNTQMENEPEYPVEGGTVDWNRTYAQHKHKVPVSKKMNIYPKYQSDEYMKTYGQVFECFLDQEEVVEIPNMQAYTGVTEGFPEAVMGSADVMGLDDGTCYDKYSRYGAYGYGYSLKKGGLGVGIDGEREGAGSIWKPSGMLNYKQVKWSDAQDRCYKKNKHRFAAAENSSQEKYRFGPQVRAENSTTTYKEPPVARNIIPRTAVVIRTWRDYNYNPESIMFLRSLISELSLMTGGEYTVHFLIHVKDDNHPIWSDEAIYNQTLKESLPEEFWGMGTLWSERQMGLIYGGTAESFYRDLPVHGVYRSAHLPLQWFSHNHPEYEYFWNLEMDVRYTGNWYKLFSSLADFAEAQPRKGLWERNGRFYVPSVHGTWEDFKHTARVQAEMPPPAAKSKWASAGPPDSEPAPEYAEPPIWGPLTHIDTPTLDTDQMPPTTYEKDKYEWGVGEQADLITLNPIFDPARTSWLLSEDITGYNLSAGMPPRRSAIIATGRLSKRLLNTMHIETSLHRHTMFTEMWPCTMALHHGLKAVYAPHPVYIDRAWPPSYLAGVLNNGLNGASGGARTSVFGNDMEHNFRGVSWYYNSGFSGNLWRRWLGKRVDNGGGEMEEVDGEGRMCLPAMLLHPIKDVDLVVQGEAKQDPNIVD